MGHESLQNKIEVYCVSALENNTHIKLNSKAKISTASHPILNRPSASPPSLIFHLTLHSINDRNRALIHSAPPLVLPSTTCSSRHRRTLRRGPATGRRTPRRELGLSLTGRRRGVPVSALHYVEEVAQPAKSLIIFLLLPYLVLWQRAAFILFKETLRLGLPEVCLGEVAAEVAEVLEDEGFLGVG